MKLYREITDYCFSKRLFCFIVNRIDSCFARINQALAREKTSTADSREEIRYAIRKINQYLYAGKLFNGKEIF